MEREWRRYRIRRTSASKVFPCGRVMTQGLDSYLSLGTRTGNFRSNPETSRWFTVHRVLAVSKDTLFQCSRSRVLVRTSLSPCFVGDDTSTHCTKSRRRYRVREDVQEGFWEDVEEGTLSGYGKQFRGRTSSATFRVGKSINQQVSRSLISTSTMGLA